MDLLQVITLLGGGAFVGVLIEQAICIHRDRKLHEFEKERALLNKKRELYGSLYSKSWSLGKITEKENLLRDHVRELEELQELFAQGILVADEKLRNNFRRQMTLVLERKFSALEKNDEKYEKAKLEMLKSMKEMEKLSREELGIIE